MKEGNILNPLTTRQELGGARHIFSDVTDLRIYLIGAYLTPDRLPDFPTKVPAGTLGKVPRDGYEGDVLYTFRVLEAVTAGTSIKVEKIMGHSVAKVGMNVMKAPETIDVTGTGVTITAIDKSNKAFDLLTVSAAITMAAGDILVEASAAGDAATYRIIPNGLTTYDLEKMPGAEQVNFNVAYAQFRGEVFELRTPPIPDAIKKAMKEDINTPCYFVYTKK